MKVLASDFDNTIYFLNDPIITKKNVEIIKRFIAEGNIFCLITGRTYMEVKKDLEKIGLPYTYLICGDGAMIFDSTDYCLQTIGLSKDVVEKTISILRKENYEPYLEDGYNITTNPNDCIKISAEYDNKELATKVVEKINKELDVYAYASRKHINVNNKANDKKQAIIRVAEIADIPLSTINVIGDSINDYEMLESFNAGVIKKHNQVLDKLNLPEYDTFCEYVEELLNNTL